MPSSTSAILQCLICLPSTITTAPLPMASISCPLRIIKPVSSPRPMPIADGFAATACAKRAKRPRLLKCESMITSFIKAKPVVIFTSPFKWASLALPWYIMVLLIAIAPALVPAIMKRSFS